MIFLLLTFDKKTRQNSTLTGNKQGNRKERKCLLADERKPPVTEEQSHGPLHSLAAPCDLLHRTLVLIIK